MIISAVVFVFLAFVGIFASEEESDVLPGHLKPLGEHRPMDGKVESLTHLPSPLEFYSRYVEASKPVIIRGILNETFPLKEWTDEYLG